MKPLLIHFPFKPYTITQRWGNPNPAYAAQFNNPAFKLHNGIDAKPHLQDTSYPVYCPVDGFYVEWIDYQPNGGGNEIVLRSKSKLQLFDQLCYARIILCHAEKILVKQGDELALGELIMIADNTGFSTGPHTHMGMYRVGDDGNKIDNNEALGSFDPSLFFIGDFAADQATLATLIKSNWRYYQYRMGLSA
jgi:murein DD-endopeptidase MepM/ murein hydrolase activator NlpD